MKVALLSTTDVVGGAAIAAYRQWTGLRRANIDAKLYVLRSKLGPRVVEAPVTPLQRLAALLGPHLDALPLKLAGGARKLPFSPGYFNAGVLRRALKDNPDVINLHWVNAGLVSIGALSRVPCPIVWTLHDMWAFTGGCHYAEACRRFEDRCGGCPQLRRPSEGDLSCRILAAKRQHWDNLNITVVAPSRWLAGEAAKSAVFRNHPIKVIPYGIDTDVFRPTDRSAARKALGLPEGKRYVLFSAWTHQDPRKGFDLLEGSLELLRQRDPSLCANTEVILLGDHDAGRRAVSGFPTWPFGHVASDARLVDLYNAADVMVVPSREDNLPNTALEAVACGTPVVGFRIGGLPDVIEQDESGYLAQPFDIADLAEGMRRILGLAVAGDDLRAQVRRFALARFSLATMAARYAEVYAAALSQVRS